QPPLLPCQPASCAHPRPRLRSAADEHRTVPSLTPSIRATAPWEWPCFSNTVIAVRASFSRRPIVTPRQTTCRKSIRQRRHLVKLDVALRSQWPVPLHRDSAIGRAFLHHRSRRCPVLPDHDPERLPLFAIRPARGTFGQPTP